MRTSLSPMCEDDAPFDGILALARRETLVLAAALQARDGGRDATIAAARLCWVLANATHFADHTLTGLQRVSASLAAVIRAADRWLPGAPADPTDLAQLSHLAARLQAPDLRLAPIDASGTLLAGLDLHDLPLFQLSVRDATVTCVVARRARLDEMQAQGARITHSFFEAASLRGSSLDDAEIEDCNLSRANLERTSWGMARCSRCDLSGSVLVDARLQGPRFVDCDLAGADLQTRLLLSTTTAVSAQFIRCDLRGTNWRGRDLCRTSFLDCKLYGAHGTDELTDTVIERPDLSRAGDGSQIGTKRDVMAHWGVDRNRG